jgi:hypothetical protein
LRYSMAKAAKKRKVPQPEKTANWPGPPGKTQPKDRSAGKPRLVDAPKKAGL